MAHTYDYKVSFFGSGTPLTQAFNAGTGATLLCLTIIVDGRDNQRTGAPTFNGSAFTQVGTRINHATGETNLEFWYLLNPDAGIHDIQVPNASNYGLYCEAHSYIAANDSVYDTYATDVTITDANSPTIDINPAGTGELIIAIVANDTNALSISSRTGTVLYETDHGAFTSGSQYILSNSSDPQTMAWDWSGFGDKAIFAVAFKDEAAASPPTVTTSAVTGITETGGTGNGNITDTGGANATRRGFCFMEGTTGDPTTANSTAYEDGSFGTGAYSLSLGTLSPATNYRVRAYATNVSGTSYGTTVQMTTKAYPTIALNTADLTDFGTDTTPTLEFTGSDGDGDDLQYQIKIGTDSALASAAEVADNNQETTTGSVHLNNITGGVDDRPGHSFEAIGGYLDSIDLLIGLQGSCSGNLYVKIYQHQGVYGTSGEPLNAVDYDEAPTPGYIAISDAFTIPGDLTSSAVQKTVNFSGSNRIWLEDGAYYFFIVDYEGTGDNLNAPFIDVATVNSHPGNTYNDGNSATNNGIVTAWHPWFIIRTVPEYYLKDSGTDTGFSNTVTPADTNPFNEGEKISYTVQAGEELFTESWYWTARVKDPSGSDTWSDWATIRSFAITELPGDHLTATDIKTDNPVIDSPTLGQIHALTATDITTGAPTIDSPTLSTGGVDELTATDITTGSPTIDSPTIGQVHNLTAADMITGAPAIDSPTIGQGHNLTATDITTGSPTIDDPAIGQIHNLTAADITTGSPTIDSPTLSTEGTDALVATDIIAGAPFLDSPTIGQGHNLVATDIMGNSPIIDSPTIGQVHALTAADITGSGAIIDSPALGQIHLLVAADMITGAPFLDSPTLGILAPVANPITLTLPDRQPLRINLAAKTDLTLQRRSTRITLIKRKYD